MNHVFTLHEREARPRHEGGVDFGRPGFILVDVWASNEERWQAIWQPGGNIWSGLGSRSQSTSTLDVRRLLYGKSWLGGPVAWHPEEGAAGGRFVTPAGRLSLATLRAEPVRGVLETLIGVIGAEKARPRKTLRVVASPLFVYRSPPGCGWEATQEAIRISCMAEPCSRPAEQEK